MVAQALEERTVRGTDEAGRAMIQIAALQHLTEQPLIREVILIGADGAADAADVRTGGLELFRQDAVGIAPLDRNKLLAAPEQRFGDPVAGGDVVVAELAPAARP